MLNEERFYRVLVLVVMFSFFLFMISFVVLIFSNALITLLNETFLESFIFIVDLSLRLILILLRYISFIFMVGGTIGLITIFINDWLIGVTK